MHRRPDRGPTRLFLRAFQIAAGLLTATLFVAGHAHAQGLGCDDSPCDEGVSHDLSITCDPVAGPSVTTATCSGPDPVGQGSLLRIAVRCFDETGMVAQEARYIDLHDFQLGQTTGFDQLVDPECDGFIASAHWIKGNTRVQAQCSWGNVPDCVTATTEEMADLKERFFLYSWILPQKGSNSCPAVFGGDTSRMEIRNGSLDHAYQGVMAGRYVCAQSPTSLVACDDGGTAIRPRGQYGHVVGFNLAPQSALADKVNTSGPNGGYSSVGFDRCCDRETDSEVPANEEDCSDSDERCSPLDIQCVSAAVFGVCRDGDATCSQPGAVFHPLDRVAWLGPRMDADPGDSTLNPNDFPRACLGFSFENLVDGEDEDVDAFDFGPAPLPTASEDDGCADPSSVFRDVDFDEVYDKCDQVVGNIAPADGLHQLTLKNEIRNEKLAGLAGFLPTDEVRIGGQMATHVSTDGDELTVEVPALPGFSSTDVQWKRAGPGIFKIASQAFVPRWSGYVIDGTGGGLLAFDSSEAVTRDANPSPTNSYLNLDCDPVDGLTLPAAAKDLALRSESSSAGDVADREIFILSDANDAGVIDSRLFGFDIQTNRLLKPDGVVLPGSGRALDIALNPDGISRAYVARRVDDDTSTLTVVNVTPGAGLWNLDDGADASPALSLTGLPLSVRAGVVGSQVMAYVTTASCTYFPVFPGPCPIWGCPEPHGVRYLYLSAVDATNPANMVLLQEYLLGSQTGSCFTSESAAASFANAGMDFSLGADKLFVANPILSRVEVIDTFDNSLNTLGNAPVVVSGQTVDVAVVNKGNQPDDESAYVLSLSSRSVTRIDVDTLTKVGSPIDLNEVPGSPDASMLPSAIAARSDGMRLFTADLWHNTVTAVDIGPAAAGEGERITSLGTGSPARRLVLLRLPYTPPPACGDAVCNGIEDPCSCPVDCGAPALLEGQCADGADDDCDGDVDCEDGDCLDDPVCAFCGDGSCTGAEDPCSCAGDCGTPPGSELPLCSDGLDNDCDAFADCLDSDCAAACAVCGNGVCEQGENCDTCSDCDGKQNGPPQGRYCCGDGIAQTAEGDGSICDGNY